MPDESTLTGTDGRRLCITGCPWPSVEGGIVGSSVDVESERDCVCERWFCWDVEPERERAVGESGGGENGSVRMCDECPSVAQPSDGRTYGDGSYSCGGGSEVEEGKKAMAGRGGRRSTEGCVRRRVLRPEGRRDVRTRDTRDARFAPPMSAGAPKPS